MPFNATIIQFPGHNTPNDLSEEGDTLGTEYICEAQDLLGEHASSEQIINLARMLQATDLANNSDN